jgi:hypothetical protein
VSAVREKFRHAFQVDPPGPAEPTPEQQVTVDGFCREVARRGLGTAGLIALEMGRPLNFIAAQTMHFFSPAVWSIAKPRTWGRYKQFATYLERRGAIDYMTRRIEHFEKELAQPDEGTGTRAEPETTHDQDD